MYNIENQIIKQGERLKKIRDFLGLNQKTFCQSIGMKQGSYSDVERGKNQISSNLAMKIATNYNISIDWLLLGQGQMTNNNGKSYEIRRDLKEMKIQSNSMQPSLINGDIITCMPVSRQDVLESKKKTIFLTELDKGEPIISFVKLWPELITVKFQNPDFKSYQIPLYDIKQFYIVKNKKTENIYLSKEWSDNAQILNSIQKLEKKIDKIIKS